MVLLSRGDVRIDEFMMMCYLFKSLCIINKYSEHLLSGRNYDAIIKEQTPANLFLPQIFIGGLFAEWECNVEQDRQGRRISRFIIKANILPQCQFLQPLSQLRSCWREGLGGWRKRGRRCGRSAGPGRAHTFLNTFHRWQKQTLQLRNRSKDKKRPFSTFPCAFARLTSRPGKLQKTKSPGPSRSSRPCPRTRSPALPARTRWVLRGCYWIRTTENSVILSGYSPSSLVDAPGIIWHKAKSLGPLVLLYKNEHYVFQTPD